MRRALPFTLAAILLSILSAAASPETPRAQTDMALQLVLAIDVSASVNDSEFALQRAGTAAALRHPTVKAAVRQEPGGIAVAVVQWSSIARQAVGLGWTVLHDPADADAFAERVAAMPRQLPGGGTMIHAGLAFAARMFAQAPGSARRRVIDLSGNGRADNPEALEAERHRLISAGITINALAIEEHRDNLTRYFRAKLIGGPGAFVVTANDFKDFETAIRAKLLREFAGPRLAARGGRAEVRTKPH